MWANTQPEGGLIAGGIEDNGKIAGCKSISQSELNEREQAGKDYCQDARASSRLVRDAGISQNCVANSNVMIWILITHLESISLQDFLSNLLILNKSMKEFFGAAAAEPKQSCHLKYQLRL